MDGFVRGGRKLKRWVVAKEHYRGENVPGKQDFTQISFLGRLTLGFFFFLAFLLLLMVPSSAFQTRILCARVAY